MSDRSGDPRLYMEDMLEYASHIEQFRSGKGEQDFQNDIQLQFAVLRAFEVLGEAAKLFMSAVPDAEHRFPSIPFQKIYATRNRLIHGYASLDLSLIWGIAVRDITPLVRTLHEALQNWPSDLT